MLRFPKPLTDYAAYAALRSVIAFLQAIPLSVCDQFAWGLSWLATDVLRARRGLVDENLGTAFPEWTDAERLRTARHMWRHLFLMVAEIAHTPRKLHRTSWRDHCEILNEQRVIRTVLREEPSVFISGHYGNFELGGYLLGLFGFPTHTVARTLDNPYVDRFVNTFRGRTGQHMLPKEGSRDAIETLMARGGSLTLLGDQSAGPRGCWVDFFGRPASTHKAVSLFTLTFDAPTVVIGVRRLDVPLQYRINATSLLDPTTSRFERRTTTLVTEWFTQELEGIIRDAPEQYWWVHRRWKGEPPRRRTKKTPTPAPMPAS